MSDKVYVGNKVTTLTKGQEYEPFSRVTMWYDDEHCYTAGDDTGRELKIDCPWATQQIVDNALQQIKGYVYRPFEATGVTLDMAAELGDGITIGGMYSVIAHMTEHFDAMGLCDVSAPGEKELDHEYPYQSPQDRELKRRVKLAQAYYGVKISRREGLTIEKTDGEDVSAKAVLNADELSFYAYGDRVLYFDPTSGTYKFSGVLNVNDKFVVDKEGNVKLAGNINLASGSIYWGDNPPNKKRYAASTSGPWHDSMQSGDIYCCDWDYKKEKWGEPYKFVGTDGRPGSDANVPKYVEVNGLDFTDITSSYIKSPRIMTNWLYVMPSTFSGTLSDTINHYGIQYKQGLRMFGNFAGNSSHEYFDVAMYDAGGSPELVFFAKDGAQVQWLFHKTEFFNPVTFTGNVQFNGNVSGVQAQFG